jgi:two-component system sensor histidine kinase VicK
MQQDFFEQSLVDALPIGAAIFTGPEHTIKAVNQEMLINWAKDKSVIGKNLHEALPELQDQPFFNLLSNIYRTGEPFHDPNGKATLRIAGVAQTFYFDYWFKPIRDAWGNIVGIMNTAVDVTQKVTEQKRAHQASQTLQAVNEELQATNEELSQSNSSLQTAVEQLNAAREAAQLGLFDWDLIGQKYAWDARFKQMFGLGAEDNPNHYYVMVDRLHPDDRDRVRKAVLDSRNQQLTGGKYDIEYRIVGAGDVPVRWARALGRVIFDPQGTAVRFIGTLMDITDQVMSREQLQAGEERLRLAIESANMGTWFIDAETRELIPSPRLKELFGFNADEEMPLEIAVNQIKQEYREMVVQGINDAIEKGASYDVEYPVVGYRDQKLRWVRATGKLYASENNQTPNFSGTIADITEQKQNEQRKNDFISMVSHELKTPLTSTIAYVQVSQKKASAKGDTVTAGMLRRASKQLDKMTKLINGFLDVARFEAGKMHIEKKRFDMAVLMREVEEGFVTEVTSHRFIFQPVEETWANIDKDKIEQVIDNFISNAIKYSPPYTTIQIACVTSGNYAHVSVRDEGMGIRPQDQEKLFDRFYRVEGQETKSIAGFGIGLFICKEIIERHEGTIGVDSEPGNGSTFWFTLPIELNS